MKMKVENINWQEDLKNAILDTPKNKWKVLENSYHKMFKKMSNYTENKQLIL